MDLTAQQRKVSEQAIDAWRGHFGEPAALGVRRLRSLEGENACLKRHVEVTRDAVARVGVADAIGRQRGGRWAATPRGPSALP